MRSRPSTALIRAALLSAALLVAMPARGEDDDAEDRFHRAYEAEVVEGKLADAAKTYLELMRDDRAPARIRAESKFRFAVTAVLLGRADEARAHFEELKDDASLPESQRARAAEYLNSAKGIGVGSELDRKLQTLVFDLGRIPATEDANPPVYRDFEILGKASVPFLRNLLLHSDVAIRTHAYRLLVRLDEPGMADAWRADGNGGSWAKWLELSAYLGRHEDEAAAFERKLLALSDADLANVLGNEYFRGPSPGLLRAAAARKIRSDAFAQRLDSVVSAGVNGGVDRSGRAALRDEWLHGDDPVLARAAAFSLLASARSEPESVAVDVAVLRLLVGRLTGASLNWNLSYWGDRGSVGTSQRKSAEGLVAIAGRCPVDGVLDVLDEVVTAAGAWKGEPDLSPARTGLADALAVAVEAAKPSGKDLTRYAVVVERWAEVVAAVGWTSDVGETRHLRFLLRALPRDEATALARRLVTGPASRLADRWIEAFGRETADDFAVALAAYRAGAPALRRAIRIQQSISNEEVDPTGDAGRAAAILAALPEFQRDVAARSSQERPERAFHRYARLLPPAQAAEALVPVIDAIAEIRDRATRHAALGAVLWDPALPSDPTGFIDVVLPVAERIWPSLATDDRSLFLKYARSAFQASPVGAPREALAALFLAHVEDAPQEVLDEFVKAPDLFPPAKWVPRARASLVTKALRQDLPEAIVTSALAEMAAVPEEATEPVRAFVRSVASEAAQREFYDRILRTADVARISGPVGEVALGAPASLDAIEAAIDRVLASDAEAYTHVGVLDTLVRIAVARRPSERLFPAVRALLGSGNKADVLAGVAAAQSLGRADLLPYLAAKLDSLDVGIRAAARDAIDSIVELGKLKEEARRRAAVPR